MTYSTSGTSTLPAESMELAKISDLIVADDRLTLRLSDGRTLQLEMEQYSWLRWLLDATPKQRRDWEIVPASGGVWWAELDNGMELQPLLDVQSIT